MEASEFRDEFAEYEKRGAVILGISPDPVKDQAKFKAKYDLPFTLLADAEHAVAELYGTWQLKKSMGRETMGVVRTTFLIDEAGAIRRVFEKVKPEGHSAEVIRALDEA